MTVLFARRPVDHARVDHTDTYSLMICDLGARFLRPNFDGCITSTRRENAGERRAVHGPYPVPEYDKAGRVERSGRAFR